MTAIMKHFIRLFKNLLGFLVLWEQVFLEMNWLWEEKEFKHLIVNTQILSPRWDIVLERYNPSQWDVLFQTFFAILARQGVPSPELSLDRANCCLPISKFDLTLAVPNGATCTTSVWMRDLMTRRSNWCATALAAATPRALPIYPALLSMPSKRASKRTTPKNCWHLASHGKNAPTVNNFSNINCC